MTQDEYLRWLETVEEPLRSNLRILIEHVTEVTARNQQHLVAICLSKINEVEVKVDALSERVDRLIKLLGHE